MKIVSGNGKKIFVFGDSFTRAIKEYFPPAFSETYYWIKPEQIYAPFAEEMISEIKPDIVVFVNYELNFTTISSWYDQRSKGK